MSTCGHDRMLSVLLTGFLCFVCSIDGNYKGHQVYRVWPESETHVKHVRALLDNNPQLEAWQEPTSAGRPVDIQVSPEHAERTTKDIQDMGIRKDVLVQDLERKIREHTLLNRLVDVSKETMFLRYHTFEDIIYWVSQKVKDCGTRCEVVNIGSSFEGRPLLVVKMSTSTGAKKKRVWIDAGIHGREWIAPATAMYFLERLIDDYGSDPIVTELVDAYDWFIQPVVNPDGYSYTWKQDRLWRKTRSRNESSECVGADANRNFDFKWNTIGTSPNPCSNTFAGFAPLSEPETHAQVEHVLQDKDSWFVFITLHSYSQLWMAPWGYTYDKPDNYQQLIDAGRVAVNMLSSFFGTNYTLGSASEILYRSSGTSRDWAKGVPKIPYVYTIELRDRGNQGFLLPKEEILPTVTETWAGLQAMIYHILHLDDAK